MWVRAQEPGWQLWQRRTSSTLRPGQTGQESWACTKPYRTRNPPLLSLTHSHSPLLLFTVALLCSVECQGLGILSCDRCSRNRRRVSPCSLSVSTQGMQFFPSLPLALSSKLFPPLPRKLKTSLGWARQDEPVTSPSAAPEETVKNTLMLVPCNRQWSWMDIENKQIFRCWFFLHWIKTEKNVLWRGIQLSSLSQVSMCLWHYLLGPLGPKADFFHLHGFKIFYFRTAAPRRNIQAFPSMKS